MFKFYPFTFSPYVKHLTIFQLKIYFRKVLGTNGLKNWLDIRLKYEDTPLKATTKYGVMISDNSLLPCAFSIYFTAQYCLFIVHKRWTIQINIATAPSARWMFYLQSFFSWKRYVYSKAKWQRHLARVVWVSITGIWRWKRAAWVHWKT